MTLAYIGFSSISNEKHSSAVHSGMAQSDFTYALLSELEGVKYFICLDSKIKFRKNDNKIPVLLRMNYLKLIIDSVRFYLIIKKEGPFRKIIIYHSFIFLPLILILRLTRREFILQVNEVFSKAGSHNPFIYKIFEKIIFYFASGYILAATPLSKHLPQCKIKILDEIPLIPGPIFISEHADVVVDSNICRMVYAGVVDRKKVGGAFIAVELATLLDDARYSLDIYGYGVKQDIQELGLQIKSCNLESRTKVRYLGGFAHADLMNKLTSYDVGLATQYIGTSFSASSFPSKILTYLSAGLHTISATSPPVEEWSFRNVIFIYSDSNLADLVSHIKSLRVLDKSCGRKNISLIRSSMLASLERLIK
jgi:hypothetical protein